jgi:hypothetical protein
MMKTPHPIRSTTALANVVTYYPPTRRQRFASWFGRWGKVALAIWIGYEVAPLLIGLAWWFK